jgi:drug/metabolite transporter (DMT)-like permease
MQLHAAYSKQNSQTPAEFISASISMQGLLGMGLMIAAFAVYSYTLSLAKASTVIPINTAATFIAVIVVGLIAGNERISPGLILGMALITAGIAVVVRSR